MHIADTCRESIFLVEIVSWMPSIHGNVQLPDREKKQLYIKRCYNNSVNLIL